MAEPNYYILLGGPEHLDFFEHNEEYRLDQWFWTVPKDARVEESAFVYLTAPVSRIVGKLVIVKEPFFNIKEFDNPKTNNKWMAEVKCVAFYEARRELTMQGLRELFPDWGWLSYPRGKTRIPEEFVEPFMELINGSTNRMN